MQYQVPGELRLWGADSYCGKGGLIPRERGVRVYCILGTSCEHLNCSIERACKRTRQMSKEGEKGCTPPRGVP